jgi:pSer/pThr/pTyr-binding forkhead associated (FHA) protein
MSNTASAAAFREACGATGPLELEITDTRRQTAERLAFEHPFVVVGRDAAADLPLRDRELSHRHAYLQVLGGRLFGIDLESRRGTRWAEAPARSGWLGPGEALEVGPFRLRVVGGLPEEPAVPAAPADPLAACPAEHETAMPGLWLEGLDNAGQPIVWRMNRVLALVGRSVVCKVRVHDTLVSRYSCALVRTAAGLWAVDLLGRPGTLVNETPARWAHLGDGDALRLGNVALRVRADLTPEPRPAAAEAAARGLPAPGAATLPGLLPAAPSWPAGPPTLPALNLPGAQAGAVEALSPVLVALTNQFAAMQQQMFDQFTQSMLMMGRMFSEMQRDQLGFLREELERLQQVNQDLQAVQRELAESQSRDRPAAAPPVAPRALPPAPESRPAPPPREVPAGNGRPPKTPPPRAAGLSDQELHAQLYQRIQELQKERETTWQKLLNRLTGKPTAEDDRL